jgi:NAD(P)-dependent dehydrogenase (short-subunit alcohol dehydrogenase family)
MTAEQALQGRSLAGKSAIVTCASSGIGLETARVLALAGADVVMAVRNVKLGESL